MRTFRNYWNQLKESSWRLGILLNGYDDLQKNKIHWISNGKYSGKWFADPFILSYDDKVVTLLVEEFDYHVHRGRLARLLVDRASWTITDCKIILDLPTHLSFPMIWRKEGKVYVCPENFHSGKWDMYEYDEQKEELTLFRTLMNEKLTDATIFEHEGETYLLSTYDPTPNGKLLTIWKMVGESFERVQDVAFDEKIARNAGKIFSWKGKLIRPAQECNQVYGHAMVFQEVSIKDGQFSFIELYRYNPTHPTFKVGTHTYNQSEGEMAVIDVKGRRYPVMGALRDFALEIAIRLHLKKRYELK